MWVASICSSSPGCEIDLVRGDQIGTHLWDANVHDTREHDTSGRERVSCVCQAALSLSSFARRLQGVCALAPVVPSRGTDRAPEEGHQHILMTEFLACPVGVLDRCVLPFAQSQLASPVPALRASAPYGVNTIVFQGNQLPYAICYGSVLHHLSCVL